MCLDKFKIDDFDDPMIYLEADSHANVSPITFTYAAEPSTSRTDVSSNVSPIAAVAAAGPVKSSVQSNNNATSSSSNSGKLNKDMILRLFNIPTLIVETANTEEKKVFWLKKAD